MKKIFYATLFCLTFYGVTLFTPNPGYASTNGPAINSFTVAQTAGGGESSIYLTEGTTTPVYLHGTGSDPSGCEDVTVNGDISGVLYRNDMDEHCRNYEVNCYPFNRFDCSFSSCSTYPDTSFNFECVLDVEYYASADSWTGYIEISDGSGNDIESTDGVQIESLLAVELTGPLEYGQLSFDSTSTTQTLTIQNTGNMPVDTLLSVDGDMQCDMGSIPAENVRYSETAPFSWGTGAALSTVPTELELDLPAQNHRSTIQSSDLYFRLKMPENGAGGSCSNVLTVTATEDEA